MVFGWPANPFCNFINNFSVWQVRFIYLFCINQKNQWLNGCPCALCESARQFNTHFRMRSVTMFKTLQSVGWIWPAFWLPYMATPYWPNWKPISRCLVCHFLHLKTADTHSRSTGVTFWVWLVSGSTTPCKSVFCVRLCGEQSRLPLRSLIYLFAHLPSPTQYNG